MGSFGEVRRMRGVILQGDETKKLLLVSLSFCIFILALSENLQCNPLSFRSICFKYDDVSEAPQNPILFGVLPLKSDCDL